MPTSQTRPLALLGYTRSGRPIRLQAGAEDARPAPPAPAPPAPPAPAPAPAPPVPSPDAQDVASLPDWAQKLITDARADAGKARTTAKEQAAAEARQQVISEFAQKLGIVDDKPDPAKLSQTLAERDAALQQAQATARTQQIELAAWQAAARQGANAAGLLDSRSFVTAVSKLDPAADDFASQLDAAVKAAVDGNPLLRQGQAPARGGAPFPGGPGGDSKPTSLHDAVAARLAGTG